jgi:outer membrane protein OmpA-like peptidoglycan-associated protein
MLRPRSFLRFTAAVSLLLGAGACGGVTQFAGAQAFTITGTPPPPPPPPPVVKEEPPPPPPRVELRDNKIDFKEKIQFEVNKAIIKEESFSLLHDIGEVIKKNPQVKKISIEGHASAEGDAKRNKKLSDERSKAVMEFLVKKEGIEAARMSAKGWGVEKPIAGNDTEEGREKNRRVEFLVMEQDVTAKKVEIDPTTGKEKVVDEKKETVKVAEETPAATPAADVKKAEPKKADAKKADAKAADAKKTEPKKADSAKAEPKKAEAVKEPKKIESKPAEAKK